MSYKVWCADEGENDGGAKTYRRKPNAINDRGWASDTEDAATMYGAHCHSQRDGWEWSWPQTFFVRDTEANTVHRFSVERETVPEFHIEGHGELVKAGPHDHENLPPDDECPCGHPFGFDKPCVKQPGWGKPCTCGDAKLEPWGDRQPRYNGSGEPCDMWTGPCSCGATHVGGA